MINREWYEDTELGRKYLEYYDAVGGDQLVLTVPYGYPAGVEEMGGTIKVYEECIRRGITWEVLIGYKDPPEDAII